MENTSKALIIAGAMLVAIMIIGFGVMAYNRARTSVANVDLSAQEVTAFNATFEQYSGEQKGSAVMQLITAVITSNTTTEGKYISMYGDENNIVAIKRTTKIYPEHTYTVKIEYAPSTGLVNLIRIIY